MKKYNLICAILTLCISVSLIAKDADSISIFMSKVEYNSGDNSTITVINQSKNKIVYFISVEKEIVDSISGLNSWKTVIYNIDTDNKLIYFVDRLSSSNISLNDKRKNSEAQYVSFSNVFPMPILKSKSKRKHKFKMIMTEGKYRFVLNLNDKNEDSRPIYSKEFIVLEK